MKQFTLTKVTALDFDETYGQSYWCEVSEQLEPVMFNSKNRSIQAGDAIQAEDVMLKTTKKGADYHRLKKVTVLGESRPTAPNKQPALGLSQEDFTYIKELLEDNNRMLKKLTNEDLGEIPF